MNFTMPRFVPLPGDEPPPRDDSEIARAVRRAFRIQTVIRHWMLIGACIVAMLVVGAGYLVLRTQMYVGTTSILVMGMGATLDAQRTSITARTTIEEQRLRLARLQAERARYEAEAGITQRPEFAEDLTGPDAPRTVQEVMDSETRLFDARAKMIENEREKLRQLLKLYNDEVQALAKQVEYSRVQQTSLDDELGGVRALVDKGLAPMTRQRDLERTAAALSSRGVEIEAQLLDRRQKIVETEQKLDEIDTTRQTTALQEMGRIDNELRDARNQLVSARSLSQIGVAGAPDPATIENQAEILTSDQIALMAAEDTGVFREDGFLFNNDPSTASRPQADILESEQQRKLLAAWVIQKNTTVERTGRSTRLDLSFTSRDPDAAGRVASSIASSYLRLTGEGEQDSGGSQVVRRALVNEQGPGAAKVLLAMLFAGLVLGTGAAFALEFFRREEDVVPVRTEPARREPAPV